MRAIRTLHRPRPGFARRCLLACVAPCVIGGCAVVTVASTAVSITASAVGLAADAAVGTVKIVGKGVGAAADAVTGGPAPAN